MSESEPKDYEISFIGRDESAAEAVLTALKRAGAEILLEGPVEKIALAYQIRMQTAAHFGYVHFRTGPEAIALIEKDLKQTEPILRFLVITPPIAKPKSRWEGKRQKVTPTEESAPERRPAEPLPLSNEALEKKIEEILK
jgi:ribosomal protein S6